MNLWAIIPVKPLNLAKSRLAEVLTSEQRCTLAEQMLRKTLFTLSQIPQVTGTIVISRDTRVLAIAHEFGARTIQESNPSALNPALMRASEVARLWGADSVFIIPSDLPFITTDDVTQMIDLSLHDSFSVVIASDRFHDGTNALLVRPVGLIEYAYGVGSYKKHIDLATQVEATVRIFESPTLQLDIDTPTDLEEYNHLVHHGHDDILTTFLPDSAT